MKPTTTTLYDEQGEPQEPVTFPSAREAREAEEACRAKLLAVLGWKKHSAKLAEVAWLLREHIMNVFYKTHGYPHGTPDLAWLEGMLAATGRRLMQLSVRGAPAVILENERKLVARREGWIAAWKKEHGDEN
jgi:hypothetical protein